MKYRVITILLSIALLHTAGFIGVILLLVLVNGYVLGEPNRGVLLAEIIIYFVYALAAAGSLIYTILDQDLLKRRRKHDNR